MTQKKKSTETLRRLLRRLADSPPPAWSETKAHVRPNLHGIIRYPAMMVPSMQGDIIDAVLSSLNRECRVFDPFVGSGTTMTESLLRGLDFTGVDINPLAILVCEAKAAIDEGVDVNELESRVLSYVDADRRTSVDIEFPNRSKWFKDDAAMVLSRIRRAICAEPIKGVRKILWTVFAETIRLCSNSRTSTYKLHIRPHDEYVSAGRLRDIFESNLNNAIRRINEYRLVARRYPTRRPKVKIICGDIRSADLPNEVAHQLLITSPPYGDNQTTIPYGQFSYLALKCIPQQDLPTACAEYLLSTTHSLDTASLGGSALGADYKQDAMCVVSRSFESFVAKVQKTGNITAARKVASFMYDFFEALDHIRSVSARNKQSAHWVMTTGNRTAGGIPVPFDAICRDIVIFLEGTTIASFGRRLPTKRMPSRNSQGQMITCETTLVAEFA